MCKTIGSDKLLASNYPNYAELNKVFDKNWDFIDLKAEKDFPECAGVKNSYAALITDEVVAYAKCIVLTKDTANSQLVNKKSEYVGKE